MVYALYDPSLNNNGNDDSAENLAQIRASVAWGGKSLSQNSQFGRSSKATDASC